MRCAGEDSSDFTFLDEAGTAERKDTVGALETEKQEEPSFHYNNHKNWSRSS